MPNSSLAHLDQTNTGRRSQVLAWARGFRRATHGISAVNKRNELERAAKVATEIARFCNGSPRLSSEQNAAFRRLVRKVCESKTSTPYDQVAPIALLLNQVK
jgi:hypothetical protein